MALTLPSFTGFLRSIRASVLVDASGNAANAGTWPYAWDDVVTVEFNGTSSTPVTINASGVELYCDVLCHIHVGDNPTATTDSKPLPPGVDKAFDITPGDQIAVIQSTEAGTLWITPKAY